MIYHKFCWYLLVSQVTSDSDPFAELRSLAPAWPAKFDTARFFFAPNKVWKGFPLGTWFASHFLPSGKQTVCYWKWQFIVDLPIKSTIYSEFDVIISTDEKVKRVHSWGVVDFVVEQCHVDPRGETMTSHFISVTWDTNRYQQIPTDTNRTCDRSTMINWCPGFQSSHFRLKHSSWWLPNTYQAFHSFTKWFTANLWAAACWITYPLVNVYIANWTITIFDS